MVTEAIELDKSFSRLPDLSVTQSNIPKQLKSMISFEKEIFDTTNYENNLQECSLWNNAIKYLLKEHNYRTALTTLSMQQYLGLMDEMAWLNLAMVRFDLSNYSGGFYSLNKLFSKIENHSMAKLYWEIMVNWIDRGLFDVIMDSQDDGELDCILQQFNINPSLSSFWLILGLYHFRGTKYELAISEFDRVTFLDESNHIGWLGILRSLVKLGKMKKASQIYHKFMLMKEK